MTPATAWLLLVGFAMGWIAHGLPWWLGARRLKLRGLARVAAGNAVRRP